MFQDARWLLLERWWVLLAFLLISLPAWAQSGPSISAVTATSVATSSDIISWTTTTPSDSQVEYGPTTSYGSITVRNTIPVTSHSMALIGLSSETVYHYRVQSREYASEQTHG